MNRLPSSVEYLKDAILLREQSAKAWKYRGQAYVKMYVPQLAVLHFNRALQVNRDDLEAAELLNLAKEDAATRNVRSREDQFMLENQIYIEKNNNTKDLWDSVKFVNELGIVLFLEEYFESASIKFEIALTNAEEILSDMPKDKRQEEWGGFCSQTCS